MFSVVKTLESRLLQAESDRVGTLLELASRHYDRNNFAAATRVALEVAAECADDPGRRSDAYCSAARAMLSAEAHDLAQEAARHAVRDAIAISDPAREAGAREVLGRVLKRRNHCRGARDELRMAGRQYRIAGNDIALKRVTMHIANTYRRQGIAAETKRCHEYARMYFKQALRAFRAALAAGTSAADDAAIAAAAADCECRLGNFGLARAQVNRALALLPEVANAAVTAEVHMAESRLHRLTGDLKAAEWAGERACAVARTLRDDTLARGMHTLAAVHDAQGRFERANDVEMRGRELLLERHDTLVAVRAEMDAQWSAMNQPALAAPEAVHDAAA